MNDVLLLAVLQSLADGDTDAARSLATLAGDGEAIEAAMGEEEEEEEDEE